jgi:dGTP triphosphohydrolase
MTWGIPLSGMSLSGNWTGRLAGAGLTDGFEGNAQPFRIVTVLAASWRSGGVHV